MVAEGDGKSTIRLLPLLPPLSLFLIIIIIIVILIVIVILIIIVSVIVMEMKMDDFTLITHLQTLNVCQSNVTPINAHTYCGSWILNQVKYST